MAALPKNFGRIIPARGFLSSKTRKLAFQSINNFNKEH